MADIQPPKKSLKILIHAMDGTGHLNACVGVAEALLKRGHTITFLVNAAFKGILKFFKNILKIIIYLLLRSIRKVRL